MVKRMNKRNLKNYVGILTSNILTKEHSSLVSGLLKEGLWKFVIVKKQHDDGLTFFHRADEKNKIKHVTVKIKDSVAKSEQCLLEIGNIAT